MEPSSFPALAAEAAMEEPGAKAESEVLEQTENRVSNGSLASSRAPVLCPGSVVGADAAGRAEPVLVVREGMAVPLSGLHW